MWFICFSYRQKMEIDINAGATFEIPSNDYQLNVCLGNISKEITENELTHMKFLLSGNVLNKFLTATTVD